jgi:hypothetical protein
VVEMDRLPAYGEIVGLLVNCVIPIYGEYQTSNKLRHLSVLDMFLWEWCKVFGYLKRSYVIEKAYQLWRQEVGIDLKAEV